MSEMRFATVAGITLHYQQQGPLDAVPLVLIHALGCDLRMWAGVVPHIEQQANIICYDQRGHGLSDCTPAPYTMMTLAEDLVGLLDHLNIEAPVLVGSSVGGMVALQTAISFPGRVNALVLGDTAAQIGTADSWNQRITTLREHGMGYLAETILARWFAPSFADQHPADYRGFHNLLMRVPLEGYIGTCAALRDSDLSDQVHQVTLPALVLCGAEDGATPPDVVREFAESLPDARFELIDNAGHTPAVENPVAMANAITQFLKEQGYV
jgi:3-oxoadipate enol-lactonase